MERNFLNVLFKKGFPFHHVILLLKILYMCHILKIPCLHWSRKKNFPSYLKSSINSVGFESFKNIFLLIVSHLTSTRIVQRTHVSSIHIHQWFCCSFTLAYSHYFNLSWSTYMHMHICTQSHAHTHNPEPFQLYLTHIHTQGGC